MPLESFAAQCLYHHRRLASTWVKLASICGVTWRTWARWERGESAPPKERRRVILETLEAKLPTGK